MGRPAGVAAATGSPAGVGAAGVGVHVSVAARIIHAAGWAAAAVLLLALIVLVLPARAVWSWYAVRPARIEAQ